MCTNFLLNDCSGSHVQGRTIDFAYEVNSRLFFRRAGHYYALNRPERCQFTWTGKYAVAGMNAFGVDSFIDGMNTQGLCGGSLWLPETSYAEHSNPANTIASIDFPQWALSSFATCNELIVALGKRIPQNTDCHQFFEYPTIEEINAPITVSPIYYKEFSISGPNGYFPLHFPFHDRTGHSIVVEFIDGQAHVYNNPVHVCTNSPQFPMQLQNLRNYMNLHNTNINTRTLNDYVIHAAGNGSGLLGLPGDPTPPSRFVRTTFLTDVADSANNADEAINLAFHIINNVDVVKGMDKNPGPDGEEDYTQWMLVSDMDRLIYAIRSHQSPQVAAIHFDDIDWDEMDSKTYLPTIPLYEKVQPDMQL